MGRRRPGSRAGSSRRSASRTGTSRTRIRVNDTSSRGLHESGNNESLNTSGGSVGSSRLNMSGSSRASLNASTSFVVDHEDSGSESGCERRVGGVGGGDSSERGVDFDKLARAVVARVPTVTYDGAVAHARWWIRYQDMLAAKKAAISSWRRSKEISAAAAAATGGGPGSRGSSSRGGQRRPGSSRPSSAASRRSNETDREREERLAALAAYRVWSWLVWYTCAVCECRVVLCVLVLTKFLSVDSRVQMYVVGKEGP